MIANSKYNLKYCFIKQLKEDYELSSSAKLVGVMLVDYYIPNKPTFPSIETLSNDCNLSKNTIIKSIDELINKKYITKKLIRRFSSFTNSYEFHSSIDDMSADMSIDTSTDSSTDSSTDRSINGKEIIEVNEVIEVKENNIKEIAEEIYSSYALKKGKAEGIKKLISYLQKSKNMENDILKIKNHIAQYNNECKEKNYKFMKHFSSYINQQPWNDDTPVEKSKTTVDVSYLAKRIKDGFGIFINKNGARVEKSNIVYDGITDYTLDDIQLKQLNDILGGSNE